MLFSTFFLKSIFRNLPDQVEEIELQSLEIDYRNMKNVCAFSKNLKKLSLINKKEEKFSYDIKNIVDISSTLPNLEELKFEHCLLEDGFFSIILSQLPNLSKKKKLIQRKSLSFTLQRTYQPIFRRANKPLPTTRRIDNRRRLDRFQRNLLKKRNSPTCERIFSFKSFPSSLLQKNWRRKLTLSFRKFSPNFRRNRNS